jgi:hypothetical protein
MLGVTFCEGYGSVQYGDESCRENATTPKRFEFLFGTYRRRAVRAVILVSRTESKCGIYGRFPREVCNGPKKMINKIRK